jgi:dihydroorotate dehydrogenase (fumarate)
MDLSVRYLGLKLQHPLMLGASPLVNDLDKIRQIEDAGASAIVMHSLFEEQIADGGSNAAIRQSDFVRGPDEYLERVRSLKEAVAIPVIASLNGVSSGSWLEYARLIEQAGADALELNVYRIASTPADGARAVETRTVQMLESVKCSSRLPVSLKLSPFYTSLSHFTQRLFDAGADGVVVFNRFYQPDIDLERLEVVHQLELSTSSELLLRLRWLAVLSAQTERSLGISGGVHSAPDALKAILAGAHGVQLVSEIFKRGPRRFSEILGLMTRWLEAHGHDSFAQIRGKMNLSHSPDPEAYERSAYLHILNACSRASA